MLVILFLDHQVILEFFLTAWRCNLWAMAQEQFYGSGNSEGALDVPWILNYLAQLGVYFSLYVQILQCGWGHNIKMVVIIINDGENVTWWHFMTS